MRVIVNTVATSFIQDRGASDSYKTDDGGLYGNATKAPPEKLQAAAAKQLANITPLDEKGLPDDDVKAVLHGSENDA